MNYNTWPNYKNDPLWHRIHLYSADEPGAAHPFSAKLAAEQNWSPQFTERAIEEYKRFVYLCCTAPQGASPPGIVDEVWHIHLTYTQEYWQQFCRNVLGRELHHHPSRGGPEEKEKHERWYTETLTLYQSTFGHAPPPDIWPPSPIPVTVHKSHFFEAGPKLRYLLLLIPFLFTTVYYTQPFPFLLNGPQFLRFYLLLIAAMAIANSISLRWKRKLLNDMLPHRHINKFGLAYLAGGEERYMLMCVSDLISKGQIIHLGNGYYCKGLMQSGGNPLLPWLAEMQKDDFTLKELVVPIPALCQQEDAGYAWLRQIYEHLANNMLLPVLVVAIGMARCVQAIINHRPALFLVMLMAVVVIVLMPLYRYLGRLQHAMGLLVEEHTAYTENIDDTTSRNLVIYGVAAISGVLLYNNLRAQSSSLVSTYSPGADGGTAGCGGSSCGGGGGGCGGGGCGGCGG